MENIIIIIPSLNPDAKLQSTLKGLQEVGFQHFVFVDDGSDEAHKANFPAPGEGITVLHHPVNRGKGAGLKTAFAYVLEHFPQAAGVVTVDGDGQHAPADVLRCAQKLLALDGNTIVLGCRNFNGDDVPQRSRVGNHITSGVFRVLCGMKISDTQTGLRAFPAQLLETMLSIEGERFDYETNMLLKCKQYHISLAEVSIQTVYLEENASSHFRPIVDSLRIYRFILAFIVSSLLSSVVDITLYYLLHRFVFAALGGANAIASTAVARLCSSLLNYTINRRKVFTFKEKGDNPILRYYALAVPQMLVSGGIVSLLDFLLKSGSGLSTVLKFIVDVILFFISYRIQQGWVFARRKKKG